MSTAALRLLLLLAILFLSPCAFALDLTGEWKADNGTRYFLRQLGSDLYWSMDGRPRVANIFMGRIDGNTITGSWVDVPGGQLLNSGTLTLRIESPDRLVKIFSSIAYGEATWTRVGAGAAPPPPVPPPAATNATWGTQADAWRGQNGSQKTLMCPPGGPTSGRLWGTDIYTDDSSVCLAAVHAGLISAAAGGTVTIEIRPGQPTYTGSSRNGVTSSGYGGWSGSFVFAGVGPPPPPLPPPPAGAPPPPAPPPAGPALPATWGTQADQWRGQNGKRHTLTCPPGGPTGGRLWGTDIYTDDSSICLAAVHAGLITAAAGGTVTIEVRAGQSSYTGSARNGVSSAGYGSWYGSFVFVGMGTGGVSGPISN